MAESSLMAMKFVITSMTTFPPYAHAWHQALVSPLMLIFISKSLIRLNSQNLFLMPITHNEILAIINCLDSSKSSGAHNIPLKFIKLSANAIAPVLCDLYNYSITSGLVLL